MTKAFVRVDVRLYAEPSRAERFLIRPELLASWGQNQLLEEGIYRFHLGKAPVTHRLLERLPGERLRFLRLEDDRWVDLFFMQCSEKTPYCTHLQVLIQGPLEEDQAEGEVEKYKLWLEALRQKLNGQWHITDADLSTGLLRGRST